MNGSQTVDKTRTGAAWSMVGRFRRGECSDGQIGLTGGNETHDHGGKAGSSAPRTRPVTRLHSALGYVTPADKLAGRETEIFDARDAKLEAAQERRRHLRQTAA